MGLLVYAVCRTGSLDPATLPPGCDGEPVHAICTEQLSALFGDGHTPKAHASEAEFEAFDRVIEAAHTQAPTLPMRYGTVFSDDALLSRALRHSTTRFNQELTRIDGMVEFTITVRRPAQIVTRPARVATGARMAVATYGTGALRSVPIGKISGGGSRSRSAKSTDSEDMDAYCRRELGDLRALAEDVHIENPGAMPDSGVMRCMVRRCFAPLFVTSFEDLRHELGFDGRIGRASPCYSFATQRLSA